MKKDFLKIIESSDRDFIPIDIDYKMAGMAKKDIDDQDYYDFIMESDNGGFFFGQSLHIYGFCEFPHYHNINFVNSTMTKEFGPMVDKLFSFGQDVFGNQYCFELESKRVIFFNIESGERKHLAPNFATWVEVLLGDCEYLTGYPISETWKSGHLLPYSHRLAPKLPFIVGGDYSVDNLYACESPIYLQIGAAIARQVYNLPDGSNVKISITKDRGYLSE